MKEIWKNLKNWQKIAIAFSIFAIIILVVLAVVFLNDSEPKVEISFDTKVNIPSSELKKIRNKMVGVIQTNTENFDANTVYYGKARDYNESFENDLNIATFVVDFDAISQSYAVTVWWPDPDDGSPNIIISCPLENSKYPETFCLTEANASNEIINFLPHTGELNSGKEYEVAGKYSGGELYLEVNVDICGDENAGVEAIDRTKEWIASLNLDPSDFKFYVPDRACNNGSGKETYAYVQANNATTNDENVNKNLPYFVPGLYNVYPLVDENNNVTAIKAELSGCTDYQTDPEEEQVKMYLNEKGINYPLNFEYCKE